MSGLKLTTVICLVCPLNFLRTCPEFVSHRTADASTDPLREYRPHSEIFTEVTLPWCPFTVFFNESK